MARAPGGRARGFATLNSGVAVIPPRPQVGNAAPSPWPIGGGATPPTNTVLPAITGTAQEGQILSVSNGTWTGSPTGYAYQWKRDGVAIAGSVNSTRTLTAADVGTAITCTVTATNAGGSTAATSAAITGIIAAATPVPVNSVAPAISGNSTVGSVLTTTNGTWSNSPTGYTYAWRRDGVDISGATAASYTLVSADASKSITCRVYATNAGGTAGATSNAIAVPAAPSVDDQRIATVSKLQRVATAAQTSNARDTAGIGITPSVASAPTLTNEVNYSANPEKFEVLGGAPLVTNDPNMWVIADADDAPNTGGGQTTFMPGSRATWQYSGTWNVKVTNSRYVEIVTRADTGRLRLWVNGRLAVPGRLGTVVSSATTTAYTLYDLGAVGTYEIGIECNGNLRFKGLRVDAGATVSKPTRADTVTALFLGDSYTAGVANNSVRGDDLMNTVAQYLGFKNSITAALSGAALQTSTGVKLIPQFYTDFVKPTIAPVADPDIIVIAAGYNDNGSQAPTIAAAYSFWQQVRADFPRSFIVIVGMWGGVIQTRSTLQNREDGMRTQFNTWADPFSLFIRSVYSIGATANSAWQLGTGYVGTPAKDGINDYILYSDRNHPTDGTDQLNGNWYMATKIRDAIIQGINALGTTYNPSAAQIARWPLNLKLTDPAGVPAGTVGSAYLLSTMATGGAIARTFSIASGTIPPGLTLQTAAGHLTGSPTTAGTYSFTMRVSDGVTTADLPVTIVVS